MADQSRGGVKYIVWSVIGIIAILITVKELGFTPTKITTPAVSVELAGGIAPKDSNANQGAAPSNQNTSQLEDRSREIKAQLAAQASETPPPTRGAADQEDSQDQQVPNIAGNWRSDPLMMTITQFGANIQTQVTMNGVIASAGQGVLTGRSLTVTYVNGLLMQGKFEATLSPDRKRLDVTDYGKGFPQQVVFYRVP